MGALSHADHRKFVETEGSPKKDTARGSGKTGDHHRYTLRLANGDVLATRVSHGAGAINDLKLVAKILRDQLQVIEADFYECVRKGKRPPRPAPERPSVPEGGLDAKLVRNLIRKAGLSQDTVAAMTKEQAVDAWNRHLAGDGS